MNMDWNINWFNEEEQTLILHNVKREYEANDMHEEEQDPLAISDPDRLMNLRMHGKEKVNIKEELDIKEEVDLKEEVNMKEEIDIKEDDFLSEQNGIADLQNTSSVYKYEDSDNTRYTGSHENGIPVSGQIKKEDISRLGEPNSSVLSVFQYKESKEKYECQVCRKQFPNESSLKQHNVLHREKRFVFHDCRKKFNESSTLKDHINTVKYEDRSGTTDKKLKLHKADKKYGCHKCHKKYSNTRRLKKHIMSVHLGFGSFKCRCNQTFFELSKFKKHSCLNKDVQQKVYLSNLSKKFECEVCKKRFLHSGNLYQHRMVHQEKKYVCDCCGKKFPDFSDTKKHIEAVHCNRPRMTSKKLRFLYTDNMFACGNCCMRFPWISLLSEHIKIVHSGIGDYKCLRCNKTFLESQNLKRHISENCRKYVCEVCNKIFTHPTYLNNHSIVHFPELKSTLKKYKCQVCGKKFSHPGNLIEHNAVHDKQKFLCDVCKRRFVEFLKLKIHITRVHCTDKSETTRKEFNIHRRDRIYACGNCDDRYCSIEELRIHIQEEHLGIGFYNCAKCSKTFSQLYYLKKHTNSKEHIREVNFRIDNKYSCGDCDKRFCTFRALRNHIAAIHLQNIDFKCKQCNKIFSAPNVLKQHINTQKHKNFKKFECDLCNRKFSYLSRLKAHIVHSRARNFVCE